MTLRRVSAKRQALIDSGAIKVGRNSTMQMTAKEFRSFSAKREKRKAMRKLSDRQIAENKAWTQFSLFIRIRDADEQGLVTCCSCGKRKPWRRMQAGHYMSRQDEATLFNEQNVHGQCPLCNGPKSGRQQDHGAFIDQKYGPGTAEALRIESKKDCRRRITDFPYIEEEYRGKVAQLLVEKPWIQL